MTAFRGESDAALTAAMFVAAAMIANHVAGKATRDALFLSNYDVTALPLMLIGASLFSIAVVFLISGAMPRLSPQRLVPWAFATSGLLLLAEWWLVVVDPSAGAIAVYLHLAAVGSVLISGFWSMVNERFDPRTAKKRIGRIAAFGTFGGLAGGILAERVGANLSVSTMLPLLALMHVFCAVMLRKLKTAEPPGSDPAPKTRAPGPASDRYRWGLQVLFAEPYLCSLALLVLMGTLSAALIDYVFKAQAAATFEGGEDLMRFFAVFYTATGLLTFVLQTLLTRLSLEKLGLAYTVGTLPSSVAVGALGALFMPGLFSAGLARAVEAIMRSSLFRSAYELFYTPVSPKQKRAAKPVVDVGVERLGDALGGGTVRLFLLLGPQLAHTAMLGAAALLAVLGLAVARSLHQGYIRALEDNLLNRAVELDLSEVEDRTTRYTLIQTMAGLDLSEISAAVKRSGPPQPASRESVPQRSSQDVVMDSIPKDPVIEQIVALRSRQPEQIRRALSASGKLDPFLAGHIIPLLAWDEVCLEVILALRRIAPHITGQLIDHLVDPKQEFAIRRRVPRILSASLSQRAAEGLLRGLRDRRFEVRFQCGWALAHMQHKNPDVQLDEEKVFSAVLREVKVDRRVWESHRLLDELEDSDEESALVDEFLRHRTNRSLEHVFRILSLTLPEEPLRVAFRGLHTDDSNLRGTALEYLESVLPAPIRQSLWPFLEDDRRKEQVVKSRDEILAQLMRSNQSIEINLRELRKKV